MGWVVGYPPGKTCVQVMWLGQGLKFFDDASCEVYGIQHVGLDCRF